MAIIFISESNVCQFQRENITRDNNQTHFNAHMYGWVLIHRKPYEYRFLRARLVGH